MSDPLGESDDDRDLDEQLRAASRACDSMVVWHRAHHPAEVFAALARACEELGIEEWDTYADGGAVTMLEEQVAELLGKPAAVFFVSGTMAQQAMLRVWCERAGSRRVAIPDLSHLLHHEDDGPRLVHGLRFEPLTRAETATAEDLARAAPGRLGAALVELPLRDAGCLLPPWEELVALSRGRPRARGAAARRRRPDLGGRSRTTTGRWPRSPASSTASTSRSTRGSAGCPERPSSATRSRWPSCAGGASGWAASCTG